MRSMEELTPESILQSYSYLGTIDDNRVKEEVINRIMLFRGRAMLEHDKKMEAQRAALLASHEVSVSKEKEVLAEQLRAVHHQAVEKEILRKLSDFPSKRRSSHGNSPIECCVERCGRWVMEAQAAYGERKQSAALLSMQSEIEHITRSVSQDADKRLPNGHNLRQVLQGRVERFLGQEQDQVDGILRVGDYSEEVSSAAREIIQLVQLNLQLAAKLAVLQALS